jgi:hypothetical protein
MEKCNDNEGEKNTFSLNSLNEEEDEEILINKKDL